MLLRDLLECSAAPRQIRWTCEWITKWEDVWSDAFESEGKRLACYPGNTPFGHPAVVRAWVATFGGEQSITPRFLVAHSDDGATLLWPFVRISTSWKQAYVRRLHPVGRWLFDYHDPVFHSTRGESPRVGSGFWRLLARELRSQGSSLCDSFELPRIRRSLIEGYAEEWPTIDRAPIVSLSKYTNIESFLETRKASLRTDLRRQVRRLSSEGHLAFRVYDPDAIDEVYDWIPGLERNRRKKYPNSRLPEGYLHNLVEFGLPESVVHCSAVTLNGKPISWHIGFAFNGVFYWYIPLYDLAYSTYSVGKIHLLYQMDWVIKNRIEKFDFLRGIEPYKCGWTDGEESSMLAVTHATEAILSRARWRASRVLNKGGYIRGWVSKLSGDHESPEA